MPPPLPEVLTEWSAWLPLAGAGRNHGFPAGPGLYRVRRTGFAGLDYIGQTGFGLRARLGMLGGVYGAVMPYRDPHTAAPALWALRREGNCDFEASTTQFTGSALERKGLEAVALTDYRLRTGASPTANFGRMPSGYRASSGNNARLAAAGKRFRGSPDPAQQAGMSAPPVEGLFDDPEGEHWAGWDWSPWLPVPDIGLVGIGLYRLRTARTDLVYIGQGVVTSRVRAHLAKVSKERHRQSSQFSGDLEVSWVELPGTPTQQLLEHENDLIAAHVWLKGAPPTAQFLG